ncbi:MAG: DUF2911 domain-containing protein [Ignavibacteria bacterium]|nr:DUF2911 domain-containing protein [Ignavibacteria bacterium]MBT8382267.1 DUF2911 domain-containing protein [Ignavibacteria bacterium]MBT8390940.1 DUF2911 domain-containing protein [Ignavibacteria bacterium]NNJ51565.1 DUF2911 domain-containing protein [Ignavibacteriaceae bacterium]NNL19956.1 DUF2911 domain-containing protein [Ignavibacteriaceae bacterium]
MMKVLILSITLLLLFGITALAQDFRTPRPSPDATVSQYVGVTEITIDYSSPGVKGRKIWDGLVPYGEVWRTGANEVTSITFSDLVKINGNQLNAGTYGIHTIPGANEWEIIFSDDTEVDDGSNYDETKDALRLKVKPEEHHYQERMTFLFTDVTDNTVNVSLVWENLKVSFGVEVATADLTLEKARSNLSWVPSFQAAQYCLQNDVNLKEAMNWIQASTLLKEVYWNTRIKAQLQHKLGMTDDAIATMEKAIELGTNMDSAPFDFDRMKNMLADWRK